MTLSCVSVYCFRVLFFCDCYCFVIVGFCSLCFLNLCFCIFLICGLFSCEKYPSGFHGFHAFLHVFCAVLRLRPLYFCFLVAPCFAMCLILFLCVFVVLYRIFLWLYFDFQNPTYNIAMLATEEIAI